MNLFFHMKCSECTQCSEHCYIVSVGDMLLDVMHFTFVLTRHETKTARKWHFNQRFLLFIKRHCMQIDIISLFCLSFLRKPSTQSTHNVQYMQKQEQLPSIFTFSIVICLCTSYVSSVKKDMIHSMGVKNNHNNRGVQTSKNGIWYYSSHLSTFSLNL